MIFNAKLAQIPSLDWSTSPRAHLSDAQGFRTTHRVHSFFEREVSDSSEPLSSTCNPRECTVRQTRDSQHRKENLFVPNDHIFSVENCSSMNSYLAESTERRPYRIGPARTPCSAEDVSLPECIVWHESTRAVAPFHHVALSVMCVQL